jgi:hypothetical protein
MLLREKASRNRPPERAASVRAADPPRFTVEQLDQMLAPIALFPDALLAQVLMATTYL